MNAADSVQVIGFSPISPNSITIISAIAYSSGDAGDVTVSTGRLTALNGGQIASGTFGTGKGGNVMVDALDSIELIGQSSLFAPSNLNAATLNAGDAGNVILKTSRLAIRDGASVNSSTLGTGNAASVTINATKSVEVSDRMRRNPRISSSLSSSAPILAETLQAIYRLPPVPSGDSGDVTITTNKLSVTGGGLVSVRNQGAGNAGTLRVNASSIFLDNQGGISAATASGVGGNIALKAENLQLRNNSTITATAGGTGNGGNLTINTGTLVALEDSDITARAVEGRGGNIQISTQALISSADSLQVAELENFLGCNLGQAVPLQQNLNQVSSTAAFIYPIILKDRLEVIFKLPGQPLGHFWHPVQQAVVEKTIEELRRALLGRNGGQVRETSQAVYRWLLEPLEPYFERSSEVDTLVFVLDGELRNIPMAVLYDGKTNEYLVEKKYALALLPSAPLFDLKAKPRQLKVLGAGISTPLEVENRRFDTINAVAELQQVKQAASSEILLDSQFTRSNLQRYLNSGDFSTVHLATHGKFSSDPEETFILTYKELLRSSDLVNLLAVGNQEATSTIELLVLSACQTAEGDRRATLGLAGLAVQSGVRSTLATLWQVSDESTIKLMEQFYKDFNQPGVSKAQKLHRAQQALLKEPKYQNPYDWAPFVLIGNWL